MTTANTGFRITGKKGFHITFENGWTVSVQFGPANYCDNYDAAWDDSDKVASVGSSTAECAVWGPDGEMVAYRGWGGNTVSNRSTPKEVLRLLKWAEARPPVKENTP